MTLPVDPASGPLRASLLDSEIGFRALVEGVVDYAIYMLDPQGIVVTWNAGAERIKGYRADEILGSHFSTFYTDDDRREGLPEQALQTAAVRGSFHGAKAARPSGPRSSSTRCTTAREGGSASPKSRAT
jgi:PAS domain-containing protein